MVRAAFTAAALLATSALVSATGSAVVVNMCDYDVYYYNTPAADGGKTEIDGTLSSGGGKYSQVWTELSNSDGWSIKLTKTEGDLSTIMQYEYTYHDDGIIWYDLSDVNGNPWDGNWEITASSTNSVCTPKQQAYRYSTDDAYGMQACPDDSTITVTLCSGDSADDGAAASASSSVAAVTSSLAAATGESTTVVTTPTTFATVTSATSTDSDGATVTDVATAVVTDVVTATYYTGGHHFHTKRHEHPHHGHF